MSVIASTVGPLLIFSSVILGIILLLVLYAISVYNGFIKKRASVRNDLRQIDIQLDRRFKVFESLISAVNKYMDHEKTTLKDVTALRKQALNAKSNGDLAGQISAENQLSSIAAGLNVQLEQYPDLKASNNVMQLQEEIVNTENKLSFAKQAYNDGVERFNSARLAFPANIIANIFGDAFKPFDYWKLSDDDKQKKEEYIAKL